MPQLWKIAESLGPGGQFCGGMQLVNSFFFDGLILKTDSPLKRYLISLFSYSIRTLLGILNSTIVPKTLGPTLYGNYNYLLNTTASLRGLLDFGTTNAFFTYSSKNVQTGLGFYFFLTLTLMQIVFLIGLIWTLNEFGYLNDFFPGQSIVFVYSFVFLAWITSVSGSAVKYGESKAETLLVQKVNIMSEFLRFFGLILLFSLGVLCFRNFLILNLSVQIFIFTWITFFFIIPTSKKYIGNIDLKDFIKVIKYFFDYCHPIIFLNLIGFFDQFFQRWFLQKISGSIEQSYFSISQQFCSVIIIFSSSMIDVLWREISFSHSKNDIGRVKNIFDKSFKLVHLICCFLSIFLAFYAKTILQEFPGKNYSAAENVLILMAFYPIYYSLSQIFTVYFYATDKMKQFRNITLFSPIVTTIFSYLLLAPKTYFIPGLELGALGLGINAVSVSIILVNIYAYFPMKEFGLNFFNFVLRQIFVPVILAIIVFFSLNFVGFLQLPTLLNMGLVFIIYFLLVFSIVFLHPSFVGFSLEERNDYKNRILFRLGKFFPKSPMKNG